ncbi:hypothetical protein M9H77_23852 [Catharanthus roseus]|uniref:Uncharacterized protein n=1 Tax=Catharanthus roseus TaxID=4058 RepID=A0ACC0AWM4_CATRO|nr:hypothetical protein M9H77_23852 [Catharanthus roseus]
MARKNKEKYVPSEIRNDEKEMKTEDVGKMTAHSAHGRVTYHRRISSFVQDLFSWIQELKTLIQYFDLRLGDLRDDLRRHYSQGCLELKKEEQSKATDWGLIGAID